MVKRIDETEMQSSTIAAMQLKSEASKGVGTPIERRLADAILENARNMDAQAKATQELLALSKASLEQAQIACEEACKATELASKAIEKAELLTYSCVDAVGEGSKQAVKETLLPLHDALLTRTEQRIKKASDNAQDSIKSSKLAADEWLSRSRRPGWFHCLTTTAKVAVVAVLISCSLLTIWTGWRVLPLVTGEVRIVYTDEYQTELDKLKEALSNQE